MAEKMQFKRYSSIERDKKIYGDTYSKLAEYLIVNGYEDVNCIYQQKVHGANFAIYFDGDKWACAKRSVFISKEGNFMGNFWVKMVDGLKDQLKNIWDTLTQENPEIKQISFHAELAGGNHNGESEVIDKMNVSQIQGNTHYCKNQFIYLFDIRVFTEGEDGLAGFFVNPKKAVQLFEREGLYHAKIRGEGTLGELMKVCDWQNYVAQELAGTDILIPRGLDLQEENLVNLLKLGDVDVIKTLLTNALEQSEGQGWNQMVNKPVLLAANSGIYIEAEEKVIKKNKEKIQKLIAQIRKVQSEGMVIKSVEDGRLYIGQNRVVLKKINPTFSENKNKGDKQKKGGKKSNAPAEAVDFARKAIGCATSMRVDKVWENHPLSVGEFQGKMFGTLLEAVKQDILDDLKKDGLEPDPTWNKYIDKMLGTAISPLIRKKFF